MEKTAKAPPGEPGGKGFSPAFGGAVPFPPSLLPSTSSRRFASRERKTSGRVARREKGTARRRTNPPFRWGGRAAAFPLHFPFRSCIACP
ncbi:hypothetical protein [Akkermansia sp.]|uniref:hypothetical protein n=1 Tax=Akkermansia sp. TaxID=1872421 RepID=UPI003992D458